MNEGFAIIVLLRWITEVDGDVSPEEQQTLTKLAVEAKAKTMARAAVDDDRALVSAAIALMGEQSERRRELFLSLAAGMTLADRRLAPPELYAMHYLARACGFSGEQVKVAYRELTGTEIPGLGTMTIDEWWRDEAFALPDAGDDGPRVRDRAWALNILGLDTDASARKIHRAYTKQMKLHDPSRYAELGDYAIEAARLIQVRIESAYDLLGRP